MFKDVEKDCIFADDIAYVSKTGVMVGDPEGNFRPDQPATRGELAAVVRRMMFRDGVFTDVLPDVVPSVVEIRAGNKLGSGVCVRSDTGGCHILTCRHVAEGNEKAVFVIIIHGGRSLVGTYKIASAVPNEDLALITTTYYVPPLPLGSPVVQGQPVAVIGSPLGLRESVTIGAVSATGRKEGAWFQLDAPINPGNSGGPIINEEGKLVGLAVAKVPDAAIPDVGTEGLGYAVGLEVIKQFLNRVWQE